MLMPTLSVTAIGVVAAVAVIGHIGAGVGAGIAVTRTRRATVAGRL